MSVDVGESFRNGLQGVFSARGIVVGLLLLAVALANLIVGQSISRHVMEWLFGQIMGGGPQQQAVMAQAGTSFPFALDLSIPVILALAFALLLVGELVRLIAIRLFASDSREAIPVDDVADGFGPAALKALVLGGAIAGLIEVVSVIPLLGAIIAWGLMLVFVFLRQVIALEDQGWAGTLSRSFELFMEDPIPIAGILFGLGFSSFLVAAGVPFLLTFFVLDGSMAATTGSTLGSPQSLVSLLGVVLATIFQVLGIAVVTDAFEQVREAVEAEEQF
ncbi:hypothetical protein SAMN05216559_1182 [Halomicrobium zhouii]|uniref:Uncharacterized protein n=1 Tax=Halomicrobium zhouii TaxID=767519 RepID=A0A1I6KNW5_9EURY|nr:hypothetical protein [Halomicrobium zhouii]SFR92925.1 hypothetical protein SAMN05216559_1182 [Halomicrobium zhouii]